MNAVGEPLPGTKGTREAIASSVSRLHLERTRLTERWVNVGESDLGPQFLDQSL